MCRRIWALSAALILVALSGGAGAFPPAPERWQEYSPSERDKAIRNYQRYREAPPEMQREIERHYQRWQEMPDQERDRVRRNYERYRQLPPQERRQFDRKYREWQKREER